jgi:uncharacterized membrane protein
VSTESPERPSRLEQEVREILERTEAQRTPIDQLGDTVHRRKVEAQRRLKSSAASPTRSGILTPEIQRIVGALALALVAALLGEVSRLLAVLAAFASLILFFSLWFPTSRTSSSERPRWRGRDLT